MPTGISYLDETWNLSLGCTRVSKSCEKCWAELVAHAHSTHPNPKISVPYTGITTNGKWNGNVNLLEDRLEIPIHWKKPRRIGVNFMSDIFHPKVPFEFILKMFAVMAIADQHTYMMLTKHPDRALEFFNWYDEQQHDYPTTLFDAWYEHLGDIPNDEQSHKSLNHEWPLKNVWFGVSVEDEPTMHRVAKLIEIPAALRWVSYEPALGAANFSPYMKMHRKPRTEIGDLDQANFYQKIDLIIGGGQTGADAKPAHPDWFREVAYQCGHNDVIYYHKQNGEWLKCIESVYNNTIKEANRHVFEDGVFMCKVGRKFAGHLLDGVEYRELP